MRAFLIRYTLGSGERGQVFIDALSTCAAIVAAFDLLGDVRTCSARPA